MPVRTDSSISCEFRTTPPSHGPRPDLFHRPTARLDASTVTGLALYREQGEQCGLPLYCTADGILHAFSRSEGSCSSFVENRSPPFAGSRVGGTPAVANIRARDLDHSERWCLVVPCQTGGILYTSTSHCGDSASSITWQDWNSANHWQVAVHMGIISAVSAVVTHVWKRTSKYTSFGENTPIIVAACMTSGQLHSIE